MPRYLIFTWDNYYPSGGFRDFREAADDLRTARAILAHRLRDRDYEAGDDDDTPTYDEGHVIDTTTFRPVVEGQREWNDKTFKYDVVLTEIN